MKNVPDKIGMEMRGTLEDLFENPFVQGSKYWHSHQRLLSKAADALMSINHKIDRDIDDNRAKGIVAQLERDLKKIGPTQKEVQAA